MKIIYSKEEKEKAVKTYKKLKSYAATIRVLGYPSRHVLFDWVKCSQKPKKNNQPQKPAKHYNWQTKKLAVIAAMNGDSVKNIAIKFNITNSQHIYKWIRKYKAKGDEGLMSKKERIDKGLYKTRKQLENNLPSSKTELKKLAAELMVKNAVLEEELKLSKKLKGVIPKQLSSKTKTQIVMNLKDKYPLRMLLTCLQLPESSYYYGIYSFKKPDKYYQLRKEIHAISDKSNNTYGSPRIWISLRKKGIIVSEKVIRRLMKEENIKVHYAKRKRKYSSYIGEVSKAPDNHINRNFHAELPNKIWLTDITEFAVGEDKVYVSPIIDCYDGKIVAWTRGRHPDIDLATDMLDNAIENFKKYYSNDPKLYKKKFKDLIIHTDRGGHYRGLNWLERVDNLGIKRSMSRIGNSGDNAACEGFFGRMKTEMFYDIEWDNIEQLENAIDRYMDFYNNTRIKKSLNWMSIQEHRDTMEKNYRKAS